MLNGALCLSLFISLKIRGLIEQIYATFRTQRVAANICEVSYLNYVPEQATPFFLWCFSTSPGYQQVSVSVRVREKLKLFLSTQWRHKWKYNSTHSWPDSCMKVSDSFMHRLLYLRGRASSTYWMRGWMDPRAGLDTVPDRKWTTIPRPPKP